MFGTQISNFAIVGSVPHRQFQIGKGDPYRNAQICATYIEVSVFSKKRAGGNDIARLLNKILKTGENVNFAF